MFLPSSIKNISLREYLTKYALPILVVTSHSNRPMVRTEKLKVTLDPVHRFGIKDIDITPVIITVGGNISKTQRHIV